MALKLNEGERIPNTMLRYLHDVDRDSPKRRKAKFICDCGNTVERDLHWVRFLDITSCGCFKSTLVADKNRKHSQAERGNASGAYRSWQAMNQRVANHPDYANRPICDRWKGEQGFENFYADMGDRPKGLTIERVDNNKGYSPDNCVWATYAEQNMNKSNSKKGGDHV